MKIVSTSIGDRGISDNFTALRLALATMVLFSHSYALSGASEPRLLGNTVGAVAVQGFFAISGYLVTGSFLDSRSPGDFILRRTLRIAPLLIVAYYASIYVAELYGLFPENPVPGIANGPIWTLSWEVLMYAMLLVAGVLGLLARPAMSSIFAVGVVLFGAFISNDSDSFTAIAPLFLLFCAGAFIRVSGDGLDLRLAGGGALLVLLLLAVPSTRAALGSAFDYFPFLHGPDIGFNRACLFATILALPFAIIAIARHAPVSIVLKNDYSYGI